MNRNELMIGDWVIAQSDEDICGEGVGTIVDRITEIYDVEGVMSVTLEDFDYPVTVGLLDPLPLTEEILNKNGFNQQGRRWSLETEKYSIFVFITDVISIDISNELRGKDSRGRADLVHFIRDWTDKFYVHQFQQILRLCGIEKEIVL